MFYPYVQINLHAYLPHQLVPCIHAAPDRRHFLITAIRMLPGMLPQQRSLIPSAYEPWITMEDAAALDCPEPPESPRAGERESQFTSALPTSQWTGADGLPTPATGPGSGPGSPDTCPLRQAHTLCQPHLPPATSSFSWTTLYWPWCPLQGNHLPARKPSPRDVKAWRSHMETP